MGMLKDWRTVQSERINHTQITLCPNEIDRSTTVEELREFLARLDEAGAQGQDRVRIMRSEYKIVAEIPFRGDPVP